MHNVEPSPFWRESAFKQREAPQTIVRSFTLSHERTAPTELRPSDSATTFAARSSRAWEPRISPSTHANVLVMPEDFEVHGPHDHAVEPHAAHGEDHAAARIAVMTAVLACVGAISAYQSGADENFALLHKNEAAIQKTEAANLWAYYQAKGEKQNLAELGAALSQEASPQRKRFEADAARYREEKEPIRKRAEALEQEVVKSNAASEERLHRHHRWAQATTIIQISIALAAITILTRRKWMQHLSMGAAAIGVVLTGLAFFGV